MKRFFTIAFGLFIWVALAATQQQKPSDVGIPAYDPAQAQTFSGTVVEVKNYQCPVSGTIGSHLSVRGMTETREVHLAPTKFLKDYEIVLNPGDHVSVTGIKFIFDGKPAMLAGTVVAGTPVTGQSTYIFRDAKGRPEW